MPTTSTEPVPTQTKPASNRGLTELQPTATLPHSPVPPQVAIPKAKRTVKIANQPLPNGDLRLVTGWELLEAPRTKLGGEAISAASLDTRHWFDATVPGTVLTSLVEQGVYPDPYFGLNNLVIPESLNAQDYWYRISFQAPVAYKGKQVALQFNGINYHAEVWLNGARCGEMTGAFARGVFDISRLIKIGAPNILAVRVSPPPHPGLPFEKSLAAGVGPNGGAMCQDGPTFIATEGWDWVPAIRDRCTGIWQDVVIHATGAVSIGDTQIVTHLPLPDTSRAIVVIRAEASNLSDRAQNGVMRGKIDGLQFEKSVSLAPHQKTLVEFQQLLTQPKLWWPNGYGDPALTDLHLSFSINGRESDARTERFGVRQIDTSFEPHLTLRVNGKKVMCKGGNWGMDDALKRVSRERLEPSIRLHRDANFTMIRNWTGENTEEDFYALCDEYGILVWNDFWISTAGYNMEPDDDQLFLDNAREVLLRFRNHPCIAVWCGRNEGSPPPTINDGLGKLVDELDGTRHYQPSSRNIDLMNSGPWSYHAPLDYSGMARGFSTELGMPCVPTVEAMRAMMPEPDLWPRSDTWSYHDLHRNKNGAAYLDAIDKNYGGAQNIEEFCRKAQMLNYVGHRAMFEAWNAKLFAPASGVLLWMSHPAWPSLAWQLYTWDYEPTAAFFGAKSGCEPVHIQLNWPEGRVAIINNTARTLQNLRVQARVFGLDSQIISTHQASASAAPNVCTPVFAISWPPSAVAFVVLELFDVRNELLSRNFYWHSADETNYQQLNDLPPVALKTAAQMKKRGIVEVTLRNEANAIALMTQVSLRNATNNSRVLPAYYSDNYVSVLPGETHSISIEYPQDHADERLQIVVEGYNVPSQTVAC